MGDSISSVMSIPAIQNGILPKNQMPLLGNGFAPRQNPFTSSNVQRPQTSDTAFNSATTPAINPFRIQKSQNVLTDPDSQDMSKIDAGSGEEMV